MYPAFFPYPNLEDEYGTPAPAPAPKPKVWEHVLVFCNKCGCTYLDSCREHGQEFPEGR